MAVLSEEQSIIRDQAKSWVSEEAPVTAFRAVRDSGDEICLDKKTWQDMVNLGWSGILVPESYGGADLGFLTFGLVQEELGRQLTASPLLMSGLVGASALTLGANESQRQQWLPAIVSGEAVFTLAVDESPRHQPQQVQTQAQSSASGWVVDGTKTLVSEGMAATAFITSVRSSGDAHDADGITLVIIPADAPGVSRQVMRTMDGRGHAQVSFDGVEVSPDQVLGEVGKGFALLDQILDRGRAGLAAEMLGTGAQAFDMTLDYLKQRKQFGRVIGSFQALGHRAAELYTSMELARSCAESALQALDAQDADAPQLCSLAKAKVGEFLYVMSNQLIQIHGGIGMTDEFDAGFYLKRARVQETTFGNQGFHRDRYARLLGF